MYVRTVLYVQYLIFLKTRKISEDLPICYRIRAVHGSRPFRAGPSPYCRASGTRTHIHRGSVVKSWPKFCKVRDCGVCRARRSRGGLFPLAYSPSKAIGRNSQKSGIPTEILKISVFGLSCVRAIVYASVIRSGSAEKSPIVFGFYYTIYYTIFPGSLALYGNLSPS